MIRIATGLFTTILCCQAAAPAQNAPPALRLLEQLVARVESNYAGYVLEVEKDPERLRQYGTLCASLRTRAADTAAEGTLGLLQDYVGWFDDGHLFVQEYPTHSAQELARYRDQTPRVSIDGLAERLRNNADTLDPIEGLWFTPDHEIAVKRTDESPNSFVGVVLETRAEGWTAGQIIAEFERSEDGRCAATLRMADHSPRRVEVRQHNLFLHMPPHTWGRRFPVAAHREATLDPVDPRAPRFRALDAEAGLISLPSLSPSYGKKLNQLCTTYRDDITTRELLIIDLRGNDGGSSIAARTLAPFYHSDQRDPPVRVHGNAHVLSCPDTIAYYERMKVGFFTPRWLRSIRERLEARPGDLIPLYEPAREHVQYVPRRTFSKPTHIAILIDEHVVSAGEAFVLEAQRHGKVRTFGRPTGGMIDYQNVTMVAIEADDHAFVLGYPVLAASARLPAGGLNRTGIAPDVAIDPSVDDVVGWVRQQYR